MGIGASIFLIALGAIIAFAFNFDVAGINEWALGLILIGAGVLGLIMTMFVWGPRRRDTTVGGADYVEERRVRDNRL